MPSAAWCLLLTSRVPIAVNTHKTDCRLRTSWTGRETTCKAEAIWQRNIHILSLLGNENHMFKMFAGRDSLLLIGALRSEPSLPVANDLR